MLNEKISVIIPTMQKDVRILQTLVKILNADDAVSEIIIINNAVRPFDSKFEGDKINVYTPDKNLYVNFSWNLGVSIAKNDIFLIINDDIICCDSFCSLVLKTGIFEKEDTGLVGIDNNYINNFSKEKVDERFFRIRKQFSDSDKFEVSDIKFKELNTYLNLGDWGSAFLGRKAAYHYIPGIYKIIYGDNYLLKRNLEEGRRNYRMSGLNFNHLHSLTSHSEEFWPVCQDDYNVADDDFRNQYE